MAKLFKNYSYVGDLPLSDADADAGVIISVFIAAYDAVGDNANDVFDIKLDNGTSYYCECNTPCTDKWSVYMAPAGSSYDWLADFIMHYKG